MGKVNHPLPWLIGLITASMVAVGTSTYLIIESPGTENKLEELTVPVERKTLRVKIEASGKVEPIQSVNISPKQPGLLAKLLVEQGQIVKKGQQLAVMENSEIQAQGVEAQARVKAAIASFEAAKINIPAEISQRQAALQQVQTRLIQAQAQLKEAQESIPRQIEQAKANVGAAQARYQLATDRVKRYQSLFQEGAVTQDRYEQEVNEFRNGEADLYAVQQRLEELQQTAQPTIDRLRAAVAQIKVELEERQIVLEQKERTAQDDIERLQAEVEAAQAQLKAVEVRFVDTIITAPFDGIITQKYATEGAFVTPTTSASSTASATSTSIIALARGLEVVAKVPEVDIAQLQPGQPVNIVADAYPDRVFQGKVKRIAPEAIVEQNVTSFEVTIAILKGQERLLSKMNVDVTFIAPPLSNALVVPTVAIVTREGEVGVMIPDLNDQPKFQPVTLGMTLDDQTQILEGLLPGDRVYIDLPEQKPPEL